MTPLERRQLALEALRGELLTVREFAYVAKQTPAAIYKRIARGLQSGVYRIGGEIRIDLAQACAIAIEPIEPIEPTDALQPIEPMQRLSKVS